MVDGFGRAVIVSALASTLYHNSQTIMAKIQITQVKSVIDRPRSQKDTIRALGLRKMHQTVQHEATPQILGMIEKVKHLLRVEQV